MMKKIPYLILTLVFVSCINTSKLPKPIVQQEISISVLNERGIAAINPKYKQSYYRLLPYLFYNENDSFNEIQGDFYNVKFNINSNLNMMPGFWKEYGSYHNSLIVVIAMSNSSTLPIKNIPISVESSKHGKFKRGKLFGTYQVNIEQQRVLFYKELGLDNRYDVLKKINDDVITINVGGQIYKFINPEITLKEILIK